MEKTYDEYMQSFGLKKCPICNQYYNPLLNNGDCKEHEVIKANGRFHAPRDWINSSPTGDDYE